jgi:ethanolaminephosphotransferase
MFDEMDGKQARRTGNSSPLGMLFDHGCDAFTVGTQTLIMTRFI